jgi:ribosomal protein S18 acetylase RimI-like enzyme
LILEKSVQFRTGIESDATSLALLFDAAGRRIVSYFWSLYAAEGQSFFEFGRENIRTNDEGKSFHKNWQIAELDNKLLGAFFGFRVPDPYPEISYDEEPEWWVPFLELEKSAAGSWLLQAISVLPEYRGQGHAHALLSKAEEVAKDNGANKITLQVEAINQIAVKTYTSNGYTELARRELIPFPFSQDTGDIILMEKNLRD